MEFQSCQWFPSWYKSDWDSSNCSELIIRDGNNLQLSEESHETRISHIFVRSIFTHVLGITCSKLLYKSCTRSFSALLICWHYSPYLLSFVMSWREEKDLPGISSDINFSLQRMYSFYGIWQVFSVCTVSLLCQLNTRNTNYGFGFHLKPHNGRNVVFGKQVFIWAISYSP